MFVFYVRLCFHTARAANRMGGFDLAVSTAAELEAELASSVTACLLGTGMGGFRSGLDAAALPCQQCQGFSGSRPTWSLL